MARMKGLIMGKTIRGKINGFVIPEGKYLGKLCPKDHDWNETGMSLRNELGACLECVRGYQKKFRANHLEQERERKREWRANNLEQEQKKDREYNANHREHAKEYYANHREHILEYAKEYRAKQKRKNAKDGNP
jgi:hypothetical protein